MSDINSNFTNSHLKCWLLAYDCQSDDRCWM